MHSSRWSLEMDRWLNYTRKSRQQLSRLVSVEHNHKKNLILHTFPWTWSHERGQTTSIPHLMSFSTSLLLILARGCTNVVRRIMHISTHTWLPGIPTCQDTDAWMRTILPHLVTVSSFSSPLPRKQGWTCPSAISGTLPPLLLSLPSPPLLTHLTTFSDPCWSTVPQAPPHNCHSAGTHVASPSS